MRGTECNVKGCIPSDTGILLRFNKHSLWEFVEYHLLGCNESLLVSSSATPTDVHYDFGIGLVHEWFLKVGLIAAVIAVIFGGTDPWCKHIQIMMQPMDRRQRTETYPWFTKLEEKVFDVDKMNRFCYKTKVSTRNRV